MREPGRPKALDPDKQNTVCSLVAAGASLRQAAHFVDCDPKSIRREAQRNDEFRRQLARAKSEANIQPLQTLHQAAKDDWRAALSWMERIDPDRFTQPKPSIVTKREANTFVAHLIESIDRAISNPRERKKFVQLLTPAMPAAMRQPWEFNARGRDTERATHAFNDRKEKRETRKILERADRDARRRELWHELGDWLPKELNEKLRQNLDLLDPEEVFAQTPGPAACQNETPAVPLDVAGKDGDAASSRPDPRDLIKDAFADVPRDYKPGSRGAGQFKSSNGEMPRIYTWTEWMAICEAREASRPPGDLTNSASLAPNNASPAANNAPPSGPNSESIAPPSGANPQRSNDLPTASGAKSHE